MKKLIDIIIPELGNIAEAKVIEILVKEGDIIEKGDNLLTLESEKTSIDIPATAAGIIKALKVELDDRVVSGKPILELEIIKGTDIQADELQTKAQLESKNGVYAGPTVRRLARELDINLEEVSPSGLKDRILKEDVEQFARIKQTNDSQNNVQYLASLVGNLPTPPVVDFSKFGRTYTQPLSRIKKLSGEFLHRNWLSAPHITQFDEADITSLDEFRKNQQASLSQSDSINNPPTVKLTLLPFVMKAIVKVLRQFPQFNASLSSDGQTLIIKQYYHLGIAVDTPEGLVVPVMRDVDQKRLTTLAAELSTMSKQARAGQLNGADMQGQSFSISSLGGIGGGFFTPIINLPDVAILGVSKAVIKPVYKEEHFEPRLLLPLSLSYDHRVIDGAEAARFISALVEGLNDSREWLL